MNSIKHLPCFLLTCILSVPGYAQLKDISVTDSIAFNRVANVHVYFQRGRPDLALPELKKAYHVFSRTKNNTGMARVYEELGRYYSANALTLPAIDLFKGALALSDKKDTIFLATLSAQLAGVFFKEKNFKQALFHDSVSLSLYQATGSIGGQAEVYLHIARIRNQQGRYEEAERTILSHSLPLFRMVGNNPGRMECFDCLASGYYARKRYSEAKWFYIQENMLARKLNHAGAITQSLAGLAKVKMKIEDYTLALQDLKEADALARQNGLPGHLSVINYELSQLYQLTGKPSDSRKALVLHNYWNNVLHRSEDKQALVALSFKRDFEKVDGIAPPKAKKVSKTILPVKKPYSIIIIAAVLALAIGALFLLRRKPSKKS